MADRRTSPSAAVKVAQAPAQEQQNRSSYRVYLSTGGTRDVVEFVGWDEFVSRVERRMPDAWVKLPGDVLLNPAHIVMIERMA